MRRNLAASFALALLLPQAASASSSGGGSGGGGGNACPNPAQFDHTDCTFDDAGTKFGS